MPRARQPSGCYVPAAVSRSHLESVLQYHLLSKHTPPAYAPGPGYLDWKTQPNPFRSFRGAPSLALPLSSGEPSPSFAELGRGSPAAPRTLDLAGIARLFELSFAVSAWKQLGASRWALRCNPSSGNLHPTEAYLACPALPGVEAGVHHYEARVHALERRASPPSEPWARAFPAGGAFIGLTSIHWREAWKYGVRAFRYSQLDLGHAIAAVRYAAATLGWRATVVAGASDDDVSRLLGLGRAPDFDGVEREQPGALLWVGTELRDVELDPLLACLVGASWTGRADSPGTAHTRWDDIDAVVAAAAKPGTSEPTWQAPRLPPTAADPSTASEPRRPMAADPSARSEPRRPTAADPSAGSEPRRPTAADLAGESVQFPPAVASQAGESGPLQPTAACPSSTERAAAPQTVRGAGCEARPIALGPAWLSADSVIRSRRSAVAFDAQTRIPQAQFFAMLEALLPRAGIPPRDALPWEPRVHPLFFVHRVKGLPMGLYALPGTDDIERRLHARGRDELIWQPVEGCPAHLRLRLLLPLDLRGEAEDIACGQAIAADGAFTAAFVADFRGPVTQHPSWYRRLFWEAGLLGHALYLEAEAAGFRATGIGCFHDDEAHRLFGFAGDEFQTLYLQAVGGPREDSRLLTLPAYPS